MSNSKHSKVIYKLLILADNFPSMWEVLNIEGFHLSKILRSEVENIRVREIWEKPFIEYYIEGIKENIGLYGIAVSPKASLKEQYELSHYKSEYLNIIHNKHENNKIDIFKKYPQYSRLCLDPNYILYASLRRRNNELFMKMLKSKKNHLLKEITHFSKETKILNYPPQKITPTRILSLLQDTFKSSGLELIVSDKRKGWFVFQRILEDDIAIYCEYEDHYGMTRGGSWSLTFTFAPTNIEFKYGTWATKDYFHLDASFLPFGGSYMDHGGSWDRVVLGAYLAGRSMNLITKRCDSIFG